MKYDLWVKVAPYCLIGYLHTEQEFPNKICEYFSCCFFKEHTLILNYNISYGVMVHTRGDDVKGGKWIQRFLVT